MLLIEATPKAVRGSIWSISSTPSQSMHFSTPMGIYFSIYLRGIRRSLQTQLQPDLFSVKSAASHWGVARRSILGLCPGSDLRAICRQRWFGFHRSHDCDAGHTSSAAMPSMLWMCSDVLEGFVSQRTFQHIHKPAMDGYTAMPPKPVWGICLVVENLFGRSGSQEQRICRGTADRLGPRMAPRSAIRASVPSPLWKKRPRTTRFTAPWE